MDAGWEAVREDWGVVAEAVQESRGEHKAEMAVGTQKMSLIYLPGTHVLFLLVSTIHLAMPSNSRATGTVFHNTSTPIGILPWQRGMREWSRCREAHQGVTGSRVTCTRNAGSQGAPPTPSVTHGMKHVCSQGGVREEEDEELQHHSGRDRDARRRDSQGQRDLHGFGVKLCVSTTYQDGSF